LHKIKPNLTGEIFSAVGIFSQRFYAILLSLLLPVFFLPDCLSQKIDLTQFSLEELMNLEVQLVSKKQENLFETTAATYVISPEDIQHSGFTNLPDLLRLAPGFAVARIDANKWAISSRGFNGVFANKLLVLIDGRSVYSPLFSGVFWNYQEVVLEDVSQIEIVRGPGATLWGSNAVNGIVNVRTKPTPETQGGLISLTAGTDERLLTSLRYGGKLNQNLFYRLDTKYTQRKHLVDSSGAASADGWTGYRAAARLDWYPQPSSQITVQGDYYADEVGQMVSIIPAENQPFYRRIDSVATDEGGHVRCRLKHQFSPANEIVLQFYYDKYIRNDVIMNGTIVTFDYDFQHQFSFNPAHEIVWGMGYRHIADQTTGTFYFSLDPAKYKTQIFSAFFQDELHFFRHKFRLIFGSKFEHQAFTGLEIQPNLRLLFSPNLHRAYWLAASRAVRIPTRVECDVNSVRGLEYARGIPVFGIIQGNPAFESEVLHAYELGFRSRLNSVVSLDLALFYNDYRRLRNYETGSWEYKFNPAPAHGMAYFLMENNMTGRTFGGEILFKIKPSPDCYFEASYSNIKIEVDLENTNIFYEFSKGTEGETPEHQALLRGSFNLPLSLKLDFGFRFVDKVPTLKIDHYFNLDAQLAWQANRNVKIFVVGQNLLEQQHAEYSPAFDDIQATEVPRGFYGKLQVQF
jgi:iron complex outermembrane receptor protein